MSFPAPVAIARVGEKMSLEIQLGFSGSGLANLGRSYGVLGPAVRLARTIFPPDRASRARRDLELVAMAIVHDFRTIYIYRKKERETESVSCRT